MGRSSEVPSPGCRLVEAACNLEPQRGRPGLAVVGVVHHILPVVGERHIGLGEAVLVVHPIDMLALILDKQLFCLVALRRCNESHPGKRNERIVNPGHIVDRIAVVAVPIGFAVHMEAVVAVHTAMGFEAGSIGLAVAGQGRIVEDMEIGAGQVEEVLVYYNLPGLEDMATRHRSQELEIVDMATVVVLGSQDEVV